MTGPTFDDVVAYTTAGWEILYLRGKIPAIAATQGGHGVLDATTDIDWLKARWRPGYNIGARVPEALIVVDTDPRHGGEANLTELALDRGGIPNTLTCFSGRSDGGRHRYFLHPGGAVNAKQLPDGVDIKMHRGYVVLDPSLHPATGRPYRWEDASVPPAPMPAWLAKILRPKKVGGVRSKVVANTTFANNDSVADWFTATTTWPEILVGWVEVHGGWRHPTATSPISATIRHDLLFVYSPNTPFDVTEPGAPCGYTRFRAWAVLEHHGDLTAAAKAARALRDGHRAAA